MNGDSPERDRSSPYPLNQDSCERDCAKEEEEEEEEEEGLFKAEEKPCSEQVRSMNDEDSVRDLAALV